MMTAIATDVPTYLLQEANLINEGLAERVTELLTTGEAKVWISKSDRIQQRTNIQEHTMVKLLINHGIKGLSYDPANMVIYHEPVDSY